ncbi:MAG: CHASE2 domain-containing protein, partial [Desulfobacterales bacterium]|nr:CHASE2 domain-containing protein [Desulfobacterales bacterium]
MKLSKANSWYGLFFIIAFTWGLIGFSRPILLEKLERPSYDWRLFQSSTQSTHSDIVLVRAGEESLNQFGVWPWPRRFHAQLLGQLNQAKTIVLDILFPEQSVPEDDLVLANAIKSHGNVILAMHIAPQYQGRQDRLIPPIAKLVQASAGAGVTNIETDIDGQIRFFHPARPVGNLMVPSLSLATLAAVTQQKPELALNANQRYVLTLGTKHFLSDAQGRIWLPHPMTKIPVYEYSQVMNGQVAPEVFANKIVMVGIAASGSADFYARPAPGGSRVVSGVQVNAEILETLLNGFIPQRVSATIEGIAAFMLAVAGILLALYGR